MLSTIQEPLFHHIRIIIGDDHEAEDALQEILFTISRKLSTLRDPLWFRAWAYRVATRDAIRHSKRARNEPFTLDATELDDLAAQPIEEIFDADLVAGMSNAVDALSPASQVVVRMHYFDGMSHTEIAEALEISAGTVKSRLAYGLTALRSNVGAR